MTTSLTTRLGTAPEEAIKSPCVVSTVGDITLSGTQTIDGVAVSVADRVLVRSQTDAAENGIYDVKAGAWTRSTDWNNVDDVINGQLVIDANSKVTYQVSYSGTIDIGVTEVSFSGNSVAVADYYGPAVGADTITVALTTTLLAYTNSLEIRVRAAGANTVSGVTINVDSLGAKSVVKNGNQALLVGDIPRAGYEMTLRYNSSSGKFELLNPDSANVHIADTTAHAASAITNTPSGSIAATDVQTAIDELDGDNTAHLTDSVDAHDASAISNVAAGNISATTVQAAIDELDAEKAALAGSTAQAFSASNLAFPATQVPSADANTLDDYEEGTWTIGVTFGGAAVGLTTSANTGSYTKIGNTVTAAGYIQLTNKGSSNGSAAITGLPFATAASGEKSGMFSLWIGNVSFADVFGAVVPNASTSFELREVTNAGTVTLLSDANFTNTSIVNLTFSYKV
jgi:uncharacterized cupin superfamily protein